MKHLAIAAGIVTSLALSACAPPYIEELDKASALSRQMTLVGTVGPFSVDENETDSRFLPARPTASSIGGVTMKSGFLIIDTPGEERLSFVSGSSENGSQTFSLAGAAAVAPYPLYQYDVTSTLSGQASLLVTNISADTYQVFMASLSGGSLVSALTQGLSASYAQSGLMVLGLSYVPQPSAAVFPDTVLSLSYFPNPAPTYTPGEFILQVNAGALFVFSSYTIFPLSTWPLTTRCLYYFSTATGASVASSYSGGQWTCFQWNGSGNLSANAMTGVTHRIDAVLSTGDLLSTEGGTLRLYDPNGVGKTVLSVDLQGLQFCYEAYVGASPYVFFSLPTTVRHGQLAFNVYAIPSSAMRGLHE